MNSIITENEVSIVNLKGFMVDNTYANWIAIKNIHGDGNPSMPMMDCGRTCFFHRLQSLDKVM